MSADRTPAPADGEARSAFLDKLFGAADEPVKIEANGVEGLPSDGWTKHEPLALARKARQWVRWKLLHLPHMTDAECDRFIASLWPAKREELFRRAVDGQDATDF